MLLAQLKRGATLTGRMRKAKEKNAVAGDKGPLADDADVEGNNVDAKDSHTGRKEHGKNVLFGDEAEEHYNCNMEHADPGAADSSELQEDPGHATSS